jgi:hypothetical protein
MNLYRIFVLIFVFLSSLVSGQIAAPKSLLQKSDLNETSSNITRSNGSDTVLFHLEMKNAQYEPTKQFLPFYFVSKTTDYNQSATPNLSIKSTQIVAEPHARIIKQFLLKHLTSKFELVQVPGWVKGKNLNQYELFPLRLNAQNQIEELIDYEITWGVSNTNKGYVARGAGSFKNNSVLATGNWYKFGVTQTGIYRITGAYLSSLGININDIQPNKIRIYGNGGKMLPEMNKDFRYDDLEENSIVVTGAEDGVFNASDYILFYATGPQEWKRTNSQGLKFRAIKNLYSDTSYYFLNMDIGDGKRISVKPSSSLPPQATTNTYDYYNFHEEDILNLGHTGRDFYGETFDIITLYKFPFTDGDFITGDTLIAEATLAAFYKENTRFDITGNGLGFSVITGGISGAIYSPYASANTGISTVLNTNSSDITIYIQKATEKSVGWLDKLTVNARRKLNLSSKQFSFRDSRTAGKVCSFSIDIIPNSDFVLWNVTDPLNPQSQQYNKNVTSIDFTAPADSLNEYCIAPTNDLYSPVYIGKIANQNLHSIAFANYVVITHPLFIKEAQRIAEFHKQKDGLSYAIATTDQIYNEFSSGRPDISGIRDFIRMLYSRNFGTPQEVKYVLLIGDGSYNNRNRNLSSNSNLIPTYQSHETLSSTTSLVTDDFYGMMEPDEGYYAESLGKVDIGVGRFMCRTVSEVKDIINKIENYSRTDANFSANLTPQNCNNFGESPMGDWRNWLLFLGDDEDNALHMSQADSLAELVKKIAPNYNSDKILLDAYQRFSTPGGARYPDASEDFIKRMRKGALLFNYTGHGGEVGLTAERMIDLEIINGLDNFNRLPLFVTATCEFSRYDDPNRTSAGELCLLNPKGGAIALFTTARLAFASFNFSLNIALVKELFKKNPDGKLPTLGDILQATKAAPTVSQAYTSFFHLLGDPALTLAYPQQKVFTSAINNIPVSVSKTDTLAALAKITVSGFVADTLGNKLTNFNGVVYPTVFDKEQTVKGLLNSFASALPMAQDCTIYHPFQFKLQKNILYRGKAKVENGNFSFTFMVPKDISFAIGPGKISYYATNGQTDAAGYYSQLVVGGASKNVTPDNEGPTVDLYLNDKNFVPGGITNEDPVLYADLSDSSGINTLGTGIGHDISVVLDENASKPVILNDYYEANLDSYQSGRVRYPYNELSEGQHRLSFKVWDIQNNSHTVYTDFIVANSAELALEHVLNYPNPFTTKTKFFFQHNKPCDPLKVTIQIYTVSGKLVKTLQKTVMCEGFKPEGVDWDGRDDFGDKLGRGVYVYRLAILDIENKKAEKIEKLVILN